MIKFILTNNLANKILKMIVKKYLGKKLGKDAVIELNSMNIVEEGSRLKMKLDIDVDVSTIQAIDFIKELL